MSKTAIFCVLFGLISCNPFSNKTKEERIRQEMRIQQMKELEAEQQQKNEQEFLIYTNKEFRYLCELISYKTNVLSDTVTLILKEYFIKKGNVLFDNELNIIKQEYRITGDDGNLVEEIISKHNFPRKTFFLVYYEIDIYYKMKEIYYTLEDFGVRLF